MPVGTLATVKGVSQDVLEELGVQILLQHSMTGLVREEQFSGRVLGITAKHEGKTLNIQARRGVILSTGGHTSNVNFRRMFDPRLTEEYQQACAPYVDQDASGELAAMDVGASLLVHFDVDAPPPRLDGNGIALEDDLTDLSHRSVHGRVRAWRQWPGANA